MPHAISARDFGFGAEFIVQQRHTARLKAHAKRPLLSAAEEPHDTPRSTAIYAGEVGYLGHLNMSGLQEVACAAGCTLHLHVRPGSFVGADTVLDIASRHKIPMSMPAVGIRLQKMLAAIARIGSEPVALEARVQVRRAMERGLAALTHPDDRRHLEALHEQLFSA